MSHKDKLFHLHSKHTKVATLIFTSKHSQKYKGMRIGNYYNNNRPSGIHIVRMHELITHFPYKSNFNTCSMEYMLWWFLLREHMSNYYHTDFNHKPISFFFFVIIGFLRPFFAKTKVRFKQENVIVGIMFGHNITYCKPHFHT